MRAGKGCILIVDDDESIRRNLRAFLEDEGFQVIGVESGEQALEILGHNAVDAAVVDMRLPGMDGNAFIERARGLDSSLCFLIFTGSVGYQVPERLLKFGMGEGQVFIKPLKDMTTLATALSLLLKTRKAHGRESDTADH